MSSACGFVAVIGAPNAGKSTLVNALVGAKVSIVTHKVQTTRSQVRGIFSEGEAQIVLVDTPGIFQPKRRLERAMVRAAWAGAEDADVVLLLYDAARKRIDEDTQRIIEQIKKSGRKAILALNKVDLIKREKLLDLAARFDAEGCFERIFMISAATGDGLAELRAFLASQMREGPWLFPEDQVADISMRLLAAEVTREKLFLQLHQELPYNLTVETESWEDFKDGSVKILQTIYVARDNQKAIVIGKGGAGIKRVREETQRELEAMIDRPVHLFLFVKVRENWIDDPARYRDLGLDFKA
ncbi:GTPase Era [Limibacillus halophilus]|jgi:GTP-binding protein Era